MVRSTHSNLHLQHASLRPFPGQPRVVILVRIEPVDLEVGSGLRAHHRLLPFVAESAAIFVVVAVVVLPLAAGIEGSSELLPELS